MYFCVPFAHTNTHKHTHTHTFRQTHTHTHAHTNIQKYIHTLTYLFLDRHIHTNIYKDTHTHTHKQGEDSLCLKDTVCDVEALMEASDCDLGCFPLWAAPQLALHTQRVNKRPRKTNVPKSSTPTGFGRPLKQLTLPRSPAALSSSCTSPVCTRYLTIIAWTVLIPSGPLLVQ
jgi:hypothetical protein